MPSSPNISSNFGDIQAIGQPLLIKSRMKSTAHEAPAVLPHADRGLKTSESAIFVEECVLLGNERAQRLSLQFQVLNCLRPLLGLSVSPA